MPSGSRPKIYAGNGALLVVEPRTMYVIGDDGCGQPQTIPRHTQVQVDLIPRLVEILSHDQPTGILCFPVRSTNKRGRKYKGYMKFVDVSELIAAQP